MRWQRVPEHLPGKTRETRMIHPKWKKKKHFQRCVTASVGFWRIKKVELVWLKMCVSAVWNADRIGYSNSFKTSLEAKISVHPSVSLPSSVSFGTGPEDSGPSGHSEEGHPLGVVLGTNAAATFPLLYPSAGFGRLHRTVARIWPRFSKHACTAARPLYTRLFFKYCQKQLDRRMEQLFPSKLESSMALVWSNGHCPYIYTFP